LKRRTHAVSGVLSSHVVRESQGAAVEAGKEAGLDPANLMATASKLVVAADPVFQPPSAAAELPYFDAARPRRRRRAGK
jgi:hypothetical protein